MATPHPTSLAGEPRTRHLGSGHLLPLDGLRGVAILAVMASHLFAVNYAGQPLAIRALGQVFYYGWMGVDLFFVLSGFLITGILVDSRKGPGYFRNFYMRRVLRIFPLYYGVLFLLLLLTPALSIQWHGIFVPLLLYLQNFSSFNRYTFNVGPWLTLNHLWSLAIEEQFYLLWPLLVFAARTRRRVLALALALSVCAALFRAALMFGWLNSYAAHHNMFARADSLLLGGALAMLYRGTHWPRILQVAPWLFLTAAALVVYTLTHPAQTPFDSLYWIFCVRYTVTALAFCGLLAWSLRPGPVSRFFSLRLLRWFGKYSYGLYVLHLIALPTLSWFFRGRLLTLTGSKALSVAGTAALVFALAALAAWLSFNLYEKRFLRLKHFFDYASRPVS